MGSSSLQIAIQPAQLLVCWRHIAEEKARNVAVKMMSRGSFTEKGKSSTRPVDLACATASYVFDRIVPGVFFGAIAWQYLMHLTHVWLAPLQPRVMRALDLSHAALALTFAALVTVLFLIRRTPTSRRAGLLPKTIALGGTFVMWFGLRSRPLAMTGACSRWRMCS